MNTKIFFIFLSLFLLISCSSEDHFLICKISEYDCDYQHNIPGIITVTKGSSRKHYALTENGMKKIEINDGEPVAYNPQTGTAVVKEVTDSSIDLFPVNTVNGKVLSSEIVLKPERTEKNGKPFFAFPTLLSGCVQNDGTIVLLVKYENLLIVKNSASPYSEEDAENIDFLYVYEKGDVKKLKKYMFPQNEISENETASGDFLEEPEQIQCADKNIYLFSEKIYAHEEAFYHSSKPVHLLRKINLEPQKEEKNITPLALIAYDDIHLSRYFEKENSLYTVTRSSENEADRLHILRMNNGYELPEEPVEKGEGEFLFSETPDGKPLVFFVKNRKNAEEEQRLEPVF